MAKHIFYYGSYPWRYYMVMPFGDPLEVNEDEFFRLVGTNRRLVPMKYDKDNINRQNFYLDGCLIGFRVR